MLGPPKARHVDRPVTAALDDLVPPDHFYRHLGAALDLGFVRELVRDRYPGIGRPSLDPVVFFRLQLTMFFEGLRSERKLLETASLHLAHRWYLGYALDEPLPDHSTLTKVRQSLGVGVFRRFFEHVVELCRDAGLVGGMELFFDSTRVRANAAADSVVPRLGRVVGDHIEALFPEGGDASDGPPGASAGAAASLPVTVVPLPPRPLPAAPPAPRRAGRQRLVLGSPHWDLLERGRLDPGRPLASGYRRLSAERVSRTDPDAALMRTAAGGPAVRGYQTHYVVDGGRARIILHALTTPGDVMEGQTLQDLLWRVRFRWRVHPKRAVGDSKYGTVANIRALEDAGIRASFSLADTAHRDSPCYSLAAFNYGAARDEFHCPQGQPLRRFRVAWERELVGYVAEPAVCNACPAKSACTPGTSGRQLRRSLHEAYLDRVRAYHATESYKRAMRKRSVCGFGTSAPLAVSCHRARYGAGQRHAPAVGNVARPGLEGGGMEAVWYADRARLRRRAAHPGRLHGGRARPSSRPLHELGQEVAAAIGRGPTGRRGGPAPPVAGPDAPPGRRPPAGRGAAPGHPRRAPGTPAAHSRAEGHPLLPAP